MMGVLYFVPRVKILILWVKYMGQESFVLELHSKSGEERKVV